MLPPVVSFFGATLVLAIGAAAMVPMDRTVSPPNRPAPISPLPQSQSDAPDSPATPDNFEYVPNELLVQFSPDCSSELRAARLAQIGGRVLEVVETPAMRALGHPGLVRVQTNLDPRFAASLLSNRTGIGFAEPNGILRTQAVSNDPFFVQNRMWGLYSPSPAPANSFGIGARDAWARGITGSKSVVVGIVDTGILHTHPDLAPNVWVNPFDPVDGKDNDGNGYVDDVHGWDFVAEDNSVYDGTIDKHGTHVAGTIGAVGGNGIGVAGVCWNVTMISCKMIGANGGTVLNAVKAMDYLIDLKMRHGMNIVATNHSYGNSGFFVALFQSFQRAELADILAVVAAGNGGHDGRGDNIEVWPFYPAGFPLPNVISVAAITNKGVRAGYSNWSPNWVHVGAPGNGIVSTVPTGKGRPSYASMSGTSMATPHVTGAVALFAAARPAQSTNAVALKREILTRTNMTASLVKTTVSGGRLNVAGY